MSFPLLHHCRKYLAGLQIDLACLYSNGYHHLLCKAEQGSSWTEDLTWFSVYTASSYTPVLFRLSNAWC